MQTMFIVIAVVIVIIFVLAAVSMFNPRLRGKWLAHQMKAHDEILKQAKPTFKSMAKQATDLRKEILEENKDAMKTAAEYEAEIQSITTKAKAKAAAEGIKEGLSSKKK